MRPPRRHRHGIRGSRRPGDGERRAATGAGRERGHPAALELDEAAHDVEAEAGAFAGAAQLVARAVELLEQLVGQRRLEADPVVGDLELDEAMADPAGRGGSRAAGAARRRGRGAQRVLDQIAQHRIGGRRIGGDLELGGDALREPHAAFGGAFGELFGDRRDDAVERQPLLAQVQPPGLEGRGVEDPADHVLEAADVAAHPLHQRVEPRRLGAAQSDRLGGELETRDRALQLVRHRGDEVLLPAAQLGLSGERPADHRDAAAEHDEKEGTFPEVLAQPPRMLVFDLGEGARRDGDPMRADIERREELRDALRRDAVGEQALGGLAIGVVQSGDALRLPAHHAALIEHPPDDLAGREDQDRDEGDAQRTLAVVTQGHRSATSSVTRCVGPAKISPSAAARRSRSSRRWASERKPTS